jgi:hypothetical protein
MLWLNRAPSSVIEKTPQFFLLSVPSANAKLFQQQVDNAGAQA